MHILPVFGKMGGARGGVRDNTQECGVRCRAPHFLEEIMELMEFFQAHPQAAIAFSGGVDSAYLLWAGMRAGTRVKAYYAKTAFQPAFELEDAKRLAQELGAELEILPVDILCREEVTANPADRCYHCKRALFETILKAAKADGFSLVLDGTNASDDVSDRPGVRALRELEVRSPLRECGMTKAEIRRRSNLPGHPNPHRRADYRGKAGTNGAGGRIFDEFGFPELPGAAGRGQGKAAAARCCPPAGAGASGGNCENPEKVL